MFELADTLVGIYKTNDISKSCSVDMTEFEEGAPDKDRPAVSEERDLVAQTQKNPPLA